MFAHLFMAGIKWWLSVFGWLGALGSWFHIIIVLGIGRGEIFDYKWKVAVFFFFWIVIACTYFSVIFTLPRPIPPEYHVSSIDEISEVAEQLNLLEVKYCDICRLLKPPRTHHCKTCGRCVLRMDHHCPLLQVCVHHHNHKFFILYLIWPCVLSVFVSLIFTSYMKRIVIKMWRGDQFEAEEHLINSAIMNALVISVSVGSLLRFQLSVLIKNRTTIEDSQLTFLDKKDMETKYIVYDLDSRIANIYSLFGKSIALWPFPVFSTPGNAVNYPYSIKYGHQIDN